MRDFQAVHVEVDGSSSADIELGGSGNAVWKSVVAAALSRKRDSDAGGQRSIRVLLTDQSHRLVLVRGK